MSLNPLFLCRKPTTDRETLALWPETKKQDVVAYRDVERTQVAARWPWFLKDRPKPSRRTVRLNCYRWEAVWR